MPKSAELADAARGCSAVRRAAALAEWVGRGRQVTAKGVPRRADVAAACAAVGVAAPERVRSAADVPDLHYPWTAALAAGLLSIEGSRVVPGPALAGWRTAGEDGVLDGWLHGLVDALTDTYGEADRADALEIGRLVLTVLATDPAPKAADLYEVVVHTLLAADHALCMTFTRGLRDPVDVATGLLTAFGAVERSSGRWRVTPLGRWALTEISTRGASLRGASERAVDGICQLMVRLRRVRPACWRRILVPADATLGDLHEVIQIAFAWDDDHLHVFTVGARRYGDPYFDFEYDEDEITLSAALARTRKPITYVYDLGDHWEHEIVLEKAVEPDPSVAYPHCVDGRGDAPVEDWCEDEEGAWITFDQADINARLARLTSGVQQISADLHDDIEVILTDAYGEAEQMSAFLTVLGEEIDFPVPATLLGNPVTVTGLDEDDVTLSLLARCQGRRERIAFADLEFQPETIEAWLHAAYLTHLGRRPAAVTPPAGWDGLSHWMT
jgi:hypothetical protein